jgi:hypothetical protein
MFWISVLVGGLAPISDVMCSILQSLDNGLDNGLEHQTKSGFGLDNGLDNPDQVWIMEWISVCLSNTGYYRT